MMYVRYPLSLRQIEDLLFERGVDICHEMVRFWWKRFGPMFAAEIRARHVEAGDVSAAISDYEGQMPGGKEGLVQQVLPYLTIDPSHPGKLRTIHDDLNPPSHDDDDIPSRQALKEALGNLRRFKKDYLD